MRSLKLITPSVIPIFIAVLFFLMAGCQKEINYIDATGPPPLPSGPEMVIGSISGIVVDERGISVSGATVTSGTKTTTTDEFGIFRFSSISISKENGYVKINKPGYFPASRSFVTTSGRTHNVKIKLIPKVNSGNFNAASGGTISLPTGGKLIIPASSVKDASGTLYAGQVNVAMTWIDPSSADLPYIMPGDLRGITTDGEERGLQSFGMIGVELTGASGQQLNIAEGKKAELNFPLPPSMQANAPATIDLWYFDEVKGMWKQEGQAIKTGNLYKAEVSHFSFWNCDAPFPLVNVCMKLQSTEGNLPLNNVLVRIKKSDGAGAYARTDSLGNICGKIPKNETLVLEILDDCQNVVVSQNIGPFSSDVNLGTITLNMPLVSSLRLRGNIVNCTNNQVTNGAVLIYTNTGNVYNVALTNGAFELLLINCTGAGINYSVLPLDNSVMQQGLVVTGSATTGLVNLGALQACGTSSSEYLNFIVDGVPLSIISGQPFHVIYATDSTGAGDPSISVSGSRTDGPTNTGLNTYFKFKSVNNPGVTELTASWITNVESPVIHLAYLVNQSQTVNITSVGASQTGFIEGNFTTQMHNNGPLSTVVCNFKVRRP